MFCSRCGKTIYSQDEKCRHCGQPIGASRFMGTAEIASYTSAQEREEAKPVERDAMVFTRTSYMSDAQDNQDMRWDEEGDGQDVTRQTVYRPVLRENEAQGRTNRSTIPETEEEEPEAEMGEEQPAEASAEPRPEPQNDAPSDEDAPKPRTQIRLKPVKLTGISPEVLAHMSDLDENIKRSQERAARKGGGSAPQAEEDGDAQEKEGRKFSLRLKMPAFGRRAPEEDDYDDEEEREEIERAGAFAASQSQPTEETGEETDGGEEEDEDSGMVDRAVAFARGVAQKFAGMDRSGRLKMGGIALAVVLVLILGSLWLGSVTADKSKIPGVTYSLYSQGIAAVERSSSMEYFQSVANLYTSNIGGVSAQFASEIDSLTALLPEKPLENDEAFLETLTTIQASLQTTGTMYTLSQAEGAAATLTDDFNQEWKKVQSAIETLKTLTSGDQLSAVRQAAAVSITDPTVDSQGDETDSGNSYIKLTKGMMNSNDVYLMQERLVQLGYLEGDCDGSFGSKTELAVKRFQKAVGLETDGIATPELQAMLFDASAPSRLTGTTSGVSTAAPSQPSAEDQDTDGEVAPAPGQEG